LALEFSEYLEHLRTNIARFDEVISAIDPSSPVPSCPEWTTSDLRDHMAGVLAFWRVQLGPDGSLDKAFFPADLGEQAELPIASLGKEILATLRSFGPDRSCWNWSRHDPTTAWVGRRMAQESAIHRADAELAAGIGIEPIDPRLASDGIDELLTVFVGARPETDMGTAPVLQVVTADTGFEWRVAVTADQGVAPSSNVADASLTGTASDVLLSLWDRPSAAAWEGNPAVRVLWRELGEFE